MKIRLLAFITVMAVFAGCSGKSIKQENVQLKSQLASSKEREAILEQSVKEKEELLKKQQEEFDREFNQVSSDFSVESGNGDIKIKKVRSGISVNVADRIFFATGRAEISNEGKKMLSRIAKTIKNMPNKVVRIDGHCDNSPIRKGSYLYRIYPTNWELAAARAINVVRYLTEHEGINPEIISASSFSYYQPIESNDTKQGRSKNRRIEIILINKDLNDALEPEYQ